MIDKIKVMKKLDNRYEVLNSVGSVLDTETFYVHPLNTDGTVDVDNSVSYYVVSDEFINGLDYDDFLTWDCCVSPLYFLMGDYEKINDWKAKLRTLESRETR